MVIKDCISKLMSGAALLLLSACNGILNGIYDEPAASVDGPGFVQLPSANEPGRIKLDATSYTRWTYIDFHTQKFDTLEVGDPEPAHWDIAIHRYDCKTNGAKVAMTGASGLNSMAELYRVNESDFGADVWAENKIIVDMSGMAQGVIRYTPSYYNPVLSSWLNVDTSNMPPTYTPSGKVYLVRFTDGTQAALLFSGFTNDAGVKGHLTIDYKYPFIP